ncbi:MAG: 3'-5' exonuclease [Chlorobiaceae bacterium]|nr:3'-5' exonuclease [Chlorobiaceae bacterium]
MYKFIADNVVVFDVEWVPDPVSGRRIYKVPDTASDDEVLEVMWREGGATPEDPRPYLKTVMCRIVSIAAVVRKKVRDGVTLQLISLPRLHEGVQPEGEIVRQFLEAVGSKGAQLVGYNSWNADLPILYQRALANRITVPTFCHRPDKPWEGADYFARFSDYNIDLKNEVGGFGKAAPSLHELASSLGIPGKMGIDGADVADLWRSGNIRRIVEYNQFDALTTYLVWLRTVYFSGKLTDNAFMREEQLLENLLHQEIQNGAEHLGQFLDAWKALRQ